LTIQEPVQGPDRRRAAAGVRDVDSGARSKRVIVASGGFTFSERDRVAELAAGARLPGIAAFKEFAQAGLLVSYGPDLPDINRRAAGFVDRIVKGARPGDLPIELRAGSTSPSTCAPRSCSGLRVDEGLQLLATQIYR
jgi:hypothetical protein